MRIGVAIPVLKNIFEGGGHTYKEFFLEELVKLGRDDEFYIFTTNDCPELQKRYPQLKFINIYRHTCSVRDRIRRRITTFVQRLLGIRDFWQPSPLDYSILNNPVDFMIVLPNFFYPLNVPYAAVIWDCGAYEQPGFEEMVEQRRFFSEYLAQKLPFASKIFVGTEVGKQEIATNFNIPKDKICVLPFTVPSVQYSASNILEKFSVKSPFLFYPAQFWAHKNHITILRAVSILREKDNISLDVVFTGSDKGNQSFVQQECEKYGLSDCVHFCGFLSNEEIGYLYSNAFALVFASCLGPDNLPPLEAMSMNCPVISSRYPGAEEQLKDGAIFFDMLDEDQLAERIKFLWENPQERQALIKRGKDTVKDSDNYMRDLFDALSCDLKIRTLWKTVS